MLFKRDKIQVNERDIPGAEKIETHLKNLELAGCVLKCTLNPAGLSFRVTNVNRAGDMVELQALADFPATEVDAILTFFYQYNNERFRFGQRVESIDEAKKTIRLYFPLIIRSNERRRFRRYTFPKKEEVHTAVITSLANGIGVSGPMLNLSEKGGALLVEKMVSIATQREVKIVLDQIPKGKVDLIRFKLPNGIEVECGGEIVHVTSESGGGRVGLLFAGIPGKIEKALKLYVDGKFS